MTLIGPCCAGRRRVVAMVQAGDASATRADLQATPGVAAERDPATKDFIFQQTMLRIKDPKRSLDFYTRVLGMTLIAKLPFDDMSFTLYFLAYKKDANSVADGAADRIEQCFSRRAMFCAALQLAHAAREVASGRTAQSAHHNHALLTVPHQVHMCSACSACCAAA